jgi:hypothetical protein
VKIKLNPDNPRQINETKFKKLKQSIQEFPKMLELRPIVVDKEGIILGGNMRYRALQELGMEIKDEWVKVADKLTDEERRRFIVEDNLEFGEFDWDSLSTQYDVDELLSWGMDEKDLQIEKEVVEDEVPEVSDEPPVSKLGEVYQLGRHRLMCGDSTKTEDVEKLMDGKKADMVFTDPPYGIEIVGGNGKVGAGNLAKNRVYSEVIGDDTTGTARDCYNTCVALGMDKFIIWGGNYFTDFLPFSTSWIIWDKRGEMNSNNFADGEMAWTNVKSRVRIYKQIWNGMIREGEHENRVHPTQKPIKVLGDILKDFSGDNETVVDLFLGSGSTLIACEQTNRICYGMELDPKYCDVIRKRYAKFIGKEDKWQEITPRI